MSKKYLLLLLIIIGLITIAVLIYVVMQNRSLQNDLAETKTSTTNTTQQEVTENNETDHSNSPKADENDNNENDENIEDSFDMTELWATYINLAYKFSLKYPRDLFYEEQDQLPPLGSGWFNVTFKGGDIDVFSIKITNENSGITLDEVAERYIANQCTDSFINTSFETNGVSYRRATNIPMENCPVVINTEDENYIPIEAFATKLSDGHHLIFTNYALNQEQLEAVLSTLKPNQ